MTYVTDTHPFLWHLAADHRLGRNAASAFAGAEDGLATVIVPTIVLAEALRVLEKKRLALRFQEVLEKLEIGWNYTTCPLDLRVISRLPALSSLTELHDRIIVATAALFGTVLITKDEAIRRSGYVPTIW